MASPDLTTFFFKIETSLKYYQGPVPPPMEMESSIPNCVVPVKRGKTSASLKSIHSVHFPNDILFLDYIRHGELERISLFIRGGRVNLDTVHISGMAAIHEAVLSGNLECVKLLLHHGADIHQRDAEGWTPLHMACSDSLPHIARYLLSKGADRELENECGEKPADLIELDNKELLELFGLAVND